MSDITRPQAIFVYGTLKRGQIREVCWPASPLCVTLATVQGRLFDLGPYPAMTAGEGTVRGEVWQFTPEAIPAVLRVLDEIEGYRGEGCENLYERVILTACLENAGITPNSQSVFAYQMQAARLPGNAEEIPSPASWPPHFGSVEDRQTLPEPFPDF